MKKNMTLLVAVLLIAAVLLTACNQTEAPATTVGGLEDSIFDGTNPGGTTQPSSGTSATQPSSGPNTSQPSTDASTPDDDPSDMPEDDIWMMDYETFQNLSGDEQREFQEKFPTIQDFFGWYNAAKDAYEMENPSIEVGGDGQVDMDEILGGGNEQ